jgi:hypothetical protein
MAQGIGPEFKPQYQKKKKTFKELAPVLKTMNFFCCLLPWESDQS